MALNWGYLRRRLADRAGLAAALAQDVEFRPLLNETIRETRFNDAFEALCGDRLLVEVADGFRVGLAEYYRVQSEAGPYGYTLLYPRWEYGTGIVADRLILTPIDQSAVYFIGPGVATWTEPGADGRDVQQRYTGTVVKVRGGEETGFERPLHHFIHFAPEGKIGEYMGRGFLRALVAPWQFYQAALTGWETDNAMRRGTLKIYAGKDPSMEQTKAFRDLGNSFTEGRSWVQIPGEKGGPIDVDVAYPSGTGPDYDSFMTRLVMEIDALFRTEALALGNTDVGSRAAGEVMNDVGSVSALESGRELVAVATRKLAEWVAREERYTGRLRAAEIPRDEKDDPLTRAQVYATLLSSGQVSWSGLDEDRVREENDLATGDEVRAWREVNESAAASKELTGVMMAEMARALAAVASGAMTPESAIGLLVIGGIDRVTAEAMVEAELAQAAKQPPATKDDGTPVSAADLLSITPQTTKRVVVVAGPPCSGKSTQAHVIARDHDGPVTVLDIDGYIYDGDVFEWTPRRSADAYDEMQRALLAAMSRGDDLVVYAAPLGSSAKRAALAQLIREAGYTPTLVAMATDADTLARRNALRPPDRQIDPKQLSAMARSFALVSSTEGWADVTDHATAKLSACCDCGVKLTTSDPDVYGITGADGRVIEHVRPMLAVEVRGVTLYPEAHAQWATDVDARAERMAALETKLDEFLRSFRPRAMDAIEAAGKAGEDLSAAAEAVKASALQELNAIVVEHFDRVEADGVAARKTEVRAQRDTPVTGGGMSPEDLHTAVFADKRERLTAGLRQALDTIVSKVVGEIMSWFGMVGTTEGFKPERATSNYVREIAPFDAAAGNGLAGIGSDDLDIPEGYVITALVRVSTKSHTVCGVCKAEDGKTFLIPEQLDELAA